MEIKDATLRGLVAEIAEMTRTNAKPGGEPVYANAYDFVDRHGVEYDPPTEADDRYPKGTPRACYQNSAVAAACYPELRYVEGYAWTAVTAGLLIHHAWNLDEDGNVVDLTWGDTGIAYLGVEFDFDEYVVGAIIGDGTGSVLDDWMRGFPLFRKPWTNGGGT